MATIDAALLIGIGAWADTHLLTMQGQGCKAEPRQSESPVSPDLRPLIHRPLSELPMSVRNHTPSVPVVKVEVDPCGYQIGESKQAQALSRRTDAQYRDKPVKPKARSLSQVEAVRGGSSQPELAEHHDSKERSPSNLVDLDIGCAKSMDQGRVKRVWRVRFSCKSKRLNYDADLSVESWSQSLATGLNLQRWHMVLKVVENIGNGVPLVPCANGTPKFSMNPQMSQYAWREEILESKSLVSMGTGRGLT